MENHINVILENYNSNPINSNIKNFKVKYYKYNSEYIFKDGRLYININSIEDVRAIYRHFMIHYKLLFFNNGFFYKIKEYKENDKIVDINKYGNIEIYITNKVYIKSYKITSIGNLINRDTIREFSKRDKKYKFIFQAFYYLHSERYQYVLCDHRFMILSQLCEGYIENSEYEKQITNKCFLERIGIYINYFRSIDKRINSKVFEVLNTYPKKIVKQIKNTRNKYSHYKKKKKIIKGKNLIYLYYILELAFRILILSDVKTIYSEEIKENMYTIHDWIMEGTKENIKEEEYKSGVYKLLKMKTNYNKKTYNSSEKV